MLSLALLIILIIGFFVGLKRGFILQLIHMIGFIVSFIVAYIYYDDLAPKLRLWIPYPDFDSGKALQMVFEGVGMDEAFYRAVAFVIIFFAVRIVLGIIGSALDFVASLPILNILNVWAGGILGFLEVYLMIFILLYIAALLPVPAIQEAINGSFLAKGMINYTPFLSAELKKWWIDYIQS
ncbi:MAG TPA: CvpA family protein [Bacillus bacterium]|uniref:Transmembrane protein YshB n=1 Tax=Siminovitchia fordii TaxID=254759 RepID=A0ABQ4KAP8_9BACI|nr:CvpA family protein [Siminovitchia fordii]GIN22130.1 putative transmembrane protein YshB [Siminovitchia fordii]HBZ09371.1 CvpA family protein [Bacillus sp. (in: firmicutes)]